MYEEYGSSTCVLETVMCVTVSYLFKLKISGGGGGGGGGGV